MNLVPKDKTLKWQFPEEKGKKDAMTFHIKVRSNRDRIETQWKKANKLIETTDDFALDTYGNIEKIENAEGKTLTDKKEIVAFCLDRLFEHQGSQLQLAIQGGGSWLDEGLIKN